MRIVTFSTLYPNAIQSRHGIFVETRLRHLLTHYPEIEAKVIAPIPWFPLSSLSHQKYKNLNIIPSIERRKNIDIHHPRYLSIPKVGMSIAPLLLAKAAFPMFKKLISEGYDFDLIDAHYFYPDGVAAGLVAKWLNKPFTITARGTDINLIPQYTLPRKQIQWAIKKASHTMTVCEALRTEVIQLGAKPEKVTTLRNGVDLDLFQPAENRDELRTKLNISGPTIISVGHLIERKGHHLVIEAIIQIPEIKLLIAGDGEDENKLKKLVEQHNLQQRVQFLGSLTQHELKDYYGACDALVLASSREGWANVLLESMACGTPVVASRIWGTPEVVQNNNAGILVERTVSSIINGIRHLLQSLPERIATRNYAEQFDWYSTSEGQKIIFQLINSTHDLK